MKERDFCISGQLTDAMKAVALSHGTLPTHNQSLLITNLGRIIQGDFFNWASPENVSRLAPPKFAWSGPPLNFLSV